MENAIVSRPEEQLEFARIIARHEPKTKLGSIERFAFYDRVKGAFALVVTGERRLYGNVLLKKGIIRPRG
jgi:L-fucose mutarotase